MPKKKYSQNIYDARKANGLTQKQLSEVLGCPVSTVSSWEHSLFKPNSTHLHKLADLLGLATDELIDESLIEVDGVKENSYSSILPTKLTFEESSSQLSVLTQGFLLLPERDKHEIIEIIKIKIASQHI